MPEKVELTFKQVKTREKPKDLITRYFLERIIGKGEDYEIYPEGMNMPEMERFGGKIYGVYQKIFYLSDKQLFIVRPNGGIHILDYSEVDQDFFTLTKYPDPNILWELLDKLKWKSFKGYKFTGPLQVRHYVKKLSPELREDIQLKSDPLMWQATVSCKCNCDIFRIQTLGETNSSGLLCDTEEYQRAELACQECGRNIVLFDPALHGYNAMIAEHNSTRLSLRKAKSPYHCQCGNNKFRVALSVVYDTDPETLASLTTKERNNSYGWFNALLKCTTCNRIIDFVDYECA